MEQNAKIKSDKRLSATGEIIRWWIIACDEATRPDATVVRRRPPLKPFDDLWWPTVKHYETLRSSSEGASRMGPFGNGWQPTTKRWSLV